MNEFSNSIIDVITDNDFRIKAFTSFLERRSESYAKLISISQDCVDAIDDESENLLVENEIDTKVREILSLNNIYADAQILFSAGYAKALDVFKTILSQTDKYSLPTNDDGSQQSVDLSTNDLQLFDAAGNPTKLISSYTIMDEMKQSYHSAVTTIAGLKASLFNNVTDRLNIFRDNISRVFQSSFSDFSNMGSYMTKLLEVGTSATDMVKNIIIAMGLSKLAQDDSITTPQNTDLYQYTGCSPSAAFCLDINLSPLGKVINIGAKIVENIYKSVFSFVSNIFNKAVDEVTHVLIDPIDLDFIDKQAYPTVDGFVNQTKMPAYARGGLTDDAWYKMKTLFGEILLKQTPVDNYPYHEFQAQYKPTCVSAELFNIINNRFRITKTAYVSDPGIYQTSFDLWDVKFLNRNGFGSHNQTVEAWISDLKDQIINCSSYYVPNDSSEQELYRGLARGNYLLWFFSIIAKNTSIKLTDIMIDGTPYDGTYYNYVNIHLPHNSMIDLYSNRKISDFETANPAVIGNLDFIKVASGMDNNNNFDGLLTFYGTNLSLLPCNIYIEDGEVFSSYSDHTCYNLILILGRTVGANSEDSSFIPYLNNVENFSPSRYYVRTDAQNIDAFNNFLNTVLSIIIIATIVIMTGVVIARVVRKIKINRIVKQARLDTKIWTGQKLTTREARRYFRLKRKNEASEAVASGLIVNNFNKDSDSGKLGMDSDYLVQIRYLISK